MKGKPLARRYCSIAYFTWNKSTGSSGPVQAEVKTKCDTPAGLAASFKARLAKGEQCLTLVPG